MDSTRLDRLTRFLAKALTRRGVLAVVSGAAVGLGQQRARGNQLGPATCGAQGAVCTHLAGCCDGLTCATSAINTNYGVCVPGEGGMASTGTTLISPFSETVVEEVTALVQTVPTTTTDPQAEREARIAELKARKDAKRTKRQTRLDTKRTTQDTRNDEQQNRRIAAREDAEEDAEDAAEAAELALGPKLQLELFFGDEGGDAVDTVKATNKDDVLVELTRIESLLSPGDFSSLTTTHFDLSPGETYLFHAGVLVDATVEEFGWLGHQVCSDSTGDGFLIKAAFPFDDVNHDFVILCDGPRITSVVETPVVATVPPPARKKKKNDDKHKGRNKNRPNQKNRKKRR